MTQRKSAKINSLLQKNATYFYIRFGILQDWNTPFPLLIPSSVAKQRWIQKFSQKSICVGITVLPPPPPPNTQCGIEMHISRGLNFSSRNGENGQFLVGKKPRNREKVYPNTLSNSLMN